MPWVHVKEKQGKNTEHQPLPLFNPSVLSRRALSNHPSKAGDTENKLFSVSTRLTGTALPLSNCCCVGERDFSQFSLWLQNPGLLVLCCIM